MIFVTVGTQLPFPRLVAEMNRLAGRTCEPVIAQTCHDLTPYPNLIVEPFMNSERYTDVIEQARLVVAHAGIGTVLAARQAHVPLILVPRRVSLGEHRNDHQEGTVRQLLGRDGITGVWDTAKLEGLIKSDLSLPETPTVSGPALEGLVTTLRSYIG
ncbi:MAG: glycosyltransferase [Pseudomonadota bacterium]